MRGLFRFFHVIQTSLFCLDMNLFFLQSPAVLSKHAVVYLLTIYKARTESLFCLKNKTFNSLRQCFISARKGAEINSGTIF